MAEETRPNEDVLMLEETVTNGDGVWISKERFDEFISRANEMAREAEATAAAQGEFLLNVSHETRTPMNGILGMAELLMGAELTAEQKGYLHELKSSADLLLLLLNDMIDLARASAGRIELEPVEFNLREELCSSMRPLAICGNEKQMELVLRVAPDVPDTLVGDADRLRQILVNLVGNAVKFTRQGEVVLTVDVESDSDDEVVLHFEVCDTGIGVPPEKQDLIFEAFLQADNSSTREFSGTGLGLAICTELVKLMEGRIWVESPSRPELAEAGGPGSSFHFTARVRKSENLQPFPPTEDLKLMEGVPVLVLDDNATSRQSVGAALLCWGTKPTMVADSQQVFAEMSRASKDGNPYRVVLIDLDTPEAGELAVARNRGQDTGNPDVSVIMLNPHGVHSPQQARKLGITAHVTKPVNDVELFRAVLRAVMEPEILHRETAAPPASKSVVPTIGRTLKILLAEDNPVNQKLASAVLSRNGHKVTVVDDGRQALDAMEKESYDVLLMDVQMPIMDGIETTKTIRSHESVSGGHLPIIAVTANSLKGDRELCLDAGMDGYTTKPMNRKALFSEIKRVLSDNAGKGNSVT